MKRYLSLFALLCTLLFAENPIVFAQLGDKLYNSMTSMQRLAAVNAMSKESDGIRAYIDQCVSLKEIGFSIDKEGGDPMPYLKEMRRLDGVYETFMKAAMGKLLLAMSEKSYSDFKELMMTGVYDMEKLPESVVSFYQENKAEEDSIPELDDYIAYQEALAQQRADEIAKRQAAYRSYKQRRINQIYKKQDAKKQAFIEEVEEERERKKDEAYELQSEGLKLQ
jgi:hypothetical protein